jgi:hypothetical protein
MTNNKQQTAVEWLVEQFTFKTIGGIYTTDGTDDVTNLVEQAKEMEKQRIETAYNKGTVHGIDYPESTLPITGEQYYNETFGGNND